MSRQTRAIPPAVSDDALSVLVERLEEDGIRIDPLDSLPEWDGRRVEFGWTIESLLTIGDRETSPHVSAETIGMPPADIPAGRRWDERSWDVGSLN